MIVENNYWNKGIVVGGDRETVQFREEDAGFLYSPSYSKTLKFYDGISAVSVSNES